MNNTKGFTLIELLAVIIILVVIALIATPITMSVVSDAKQSGAISETKIIAQSVENYCKTEYYKKSINPSYTVVCDVDEGSTKTLTSEEIANMVDIPEGTSLSITVNDKGTITDGYVTTNGYQVSATTFTVAGPDTTPPVITLIGASTLSIARGSTYTDAGASAIDDIDGNITASIVRTGSVNTGINGTYYLYYNVSDEAGNAATQVIRTVTVSYTPHTGGGTN